MEKFMQLGEKYFGDNGVLTKDLTTSLSVLVICALFCILLAYFYASA